MAEWVAAIAVAGLSIIAFVFCPLILFAAGQDWGNRGWTRGAVLTILAVYAAFTAVGVILFWAYLTIVPGGPL